MQAEVVAVSNDAGVSNVTSAEMFSAALTLTQHIGSSMLRLCSPDDWERVHSSIEDGIARLYKPFSLKRTIH